MQAIHVGVLRLGLTVPGARTLKHRRQAVVSVRDRVRHRFDVTFNELATDERQDQTVAVCTTAGKDARSIRSILDRVASFVGQSGRVLVTSVDVDVIPWHPSVQSWDPDDFNLP